MEEGVQRRLLAELGMGKNPHLKKRQTGAITTWANYNPGKANSKALHLNPAGKKDRMLGWSEETAQMTEQREEELARKTTGLLCKQEAERC